VVVACQMAHDSLILPNPEADLKAIDALAEVAVTRGKAHEFYSMFSCCKALVEYRQGHFAQAIQWATLATNGPPYSMAESWAIASMADYKLGEINAAQQALSNCNRFIQNEIPWWSETAPGRDWRSSVTTLALRSEAKRMIDGEVSPSSHSAIRSQ